MFEQRDEVLERLIGHLKRPVQVDSAMDRRVLQEIARLPLPRRGRLGVLWGWLVTPRRIAISPLGGLVAAAAAIALLLFRPWTPPAAPVLDGVPFQFVVVAPGAASVSLVGDFNDWDPMQTPMRATGAGAVWTAVLPLTPGRYRYAFLVDGTEWLADPSAPAGGADGFGAPSSVVTVGGA